MDRKRTALSCLVWTMAALALVAACAPKTQETSVVTAAPDPTAPGALLSTRETAAAPTTTRGVTQAVTRTATHTPALTGTATPTLTPTHIAPPPPANASIVGVEMMRLNPNRHLPLAQAAGVAWLRRNGLLWADVEPVPGERRWEAMSGLEAELRAAYDAGLETILIIRRTPDWAQQVPAYYCGPVRDDALDDLARFLADAVARYKDPPYGVKYWELWNEPDVDPALAQPDWPFGCWGDQEDEYYGGGDYARMLKVVYPAIKAADPQARVLIGGLLLDKDPAVDPLPHPPGLFLEGILRGGGEDYFDVVSFHSYVYYDGQLGDWEKQNPGWIQRGGTLVGKTAFVREVLARYGLDKPLLLSEAGIVCAGCPSPPSDEFLAAQVAYLPRVYARSMALDLMAAVWFTFEGPGWQQSALLDEQQQPRPAYYALQTTARFLAGAHVIRPISEFDGLAGYALERQGREIWVLWSQTEAVVQLALPVRAQEAYDALGVPLAHSGGQLDVGFAPVFIELLP